MLHFPGFARLALGSATLLSAALLSAGCATSTSPSSNTAGPGGTLYFEQSGIGIESINLTTGTVTTVVQGEMPNMRSDGWMLAVIANDLAFVSPDGSKKQVIVPRNTGVPYDATFDDAFHDPQLSPDGRYVAYDQFQANMSFVVSVSTGALVATIGNPATGQYYVRPSWGLDGSLYVQAVPFATVQVSGGIFKIGSDFQSMVRWDQGLTNPSQPSVSPDGSTIAFVMNSHVWTMGIDGLNPKQLTTSDWTEDRPTWSPDSKWIAINTDKCDLMLIPIGGGTSVDLHTKFPNSIGNLSHCPSPAGQMDWN